MIVFHSIPHDPEASNHDGLSHNCRSIGREWQGPIAHSLCEQLPSSSVPSPWPSPCPAIPFLVFGHQFEAWLDATVHQVVDPTFAALLIIGLLSTDVLLPIPSSVLSTLGGEALGFGLGTAASFVGLMLGAVFGFGLARVRGTSAGRSPCPGRRSAAYRPTQRANGDRPVDRHATNPDFR